jgi:hypothetical protein
MFNLIARTGAAVLFIAGAFFAFAGTTPPDAIAAAALEIAGALLFVWSLL